LRSIAPVESARWPRLLPALAVLDRLIHKLCRHTRHFPGADPAGLALGMRSAALSAAEALLEGGDGCERCERCERRELAEQLPIAARRLREVGFYIEVTCRLGYLPPAIAAELLAGQLRASDEITTLAWRLESGRPAR
jgi:hypothetical protein